MAKPKILAFAGSTRDGSFNKMLVKVAMGAAQAAVTSKTKALLPTHYNAPIDPDALAALARRHQLRVVEDAVAVLPGSSA